MAATRRSLPRPPAVARVLERVTGTIRAHEMIGAGQTVVACVSGGPDSLCLLESLVRLRRLFRMRVEVFHFDHRLRPDSGDDAAYVHRAAGRLGVPFHLRAADAAPGPGESVEAWARLARLRAANQLAKELEAQPIATGHTLDDQAETVLLNLIRGSGLEGLAGIEPGSAAGAGTHGRTVVHPLIEVRRAEVVAFCRALRLRPRRDPMNDDTRFLRAAIRHEVLPEIERAVGRDVKGPIARTAENLRADRARARSADGARRARDRRGGARPRRPLRRRAAPRALAGARAAGRADGRLRRSLERRGCTLVEGRDRGGPRPRPGPARPAARPSERVDGRPRAGVCSRLLRLAFSWAFPPRVTPASSEQEGAT